MLRSALPPRRPAAVAAALAPALALAAAALVTAAFQLDRGAAVTTAAFGWLALGVLGALALVPGVPRVLPAVAALAVGLALLGLPHLGVLRPAVVQALLVAAVVSHGAVALRGPARLGAGGWFALALAAQLPLAADRLFLAATAPATAGVLLALPLAAALALDRIERAGGAPLAAPAALTAFLAGPGFTLAAAAALALAALLAAAPRFRPPARAGTIALAAAAPLALGDEPPWLALAIAATAALAAGGSGRPARVARGALVALALGATLAAALPWRRAAPAATLLGALAAPPGRTALRALEIQPVVLSAAAPRYAVELDGIRAGALVIDSYLTRAVELPCGTPIARIRLELVDGSVRESRLEIGRDSAEWAAERPDVAAALACPAPPAWTSWLPAGGGFLGHHYRARLRLQAPVAARRLAVERASDLPEPTALALFHLAVER